MMVRKRKIYINNLIIMASVGVYDHEKQNRQKIIINLELLLTNDSEPEYDNLKETQDYSQFRNILIEITQSQHFQLLETLADNIYTTLMKNNYVIGIKIKISKPNIFSDCEVGYELSSI